MGSAATTIHPATTNGGSVLRVREVELVKSEWLERVALAEAAIPLIGRLSRERNVIPHVHGRKIVNRSATQILRALRVAQQVDGVAVDAGEALIALQLADEMGLQGVSLDLGELLGRVSRDAPFEQSVRDILGELHSWEHQGPTDVVLFGFGRIGRLVARILVGHAGDRFGLQLRAIVVRGTGEHDLEKRANLLRYDSVHGAFDGTVDVDDEAKTIIANGTVIQVISADDPAGVDYSAYGIDNAVVVDNTGRWRDEDGLGRHLESQGVARVLLTAPGKNPLPNVVFGINHDTVAADAQLVTAASCTTNAITPVLKVIDDAFGIRHGHVETVHSYTNDQNLIDNFHKGDRRGRSAALNMVITETGAAKAVAKALPHLEGKLTGNSIRVPTPDVSMAILSLDLAMDATKDQVNDLLRTMSLTGPLRTQIGYVESPEMVSSDFVGNNRAGVVDGLATIATGHHLVLYVWYDNEYGYSSQVVRLLEFLAEQLQESPSTPRVARLAGAASGG
jgi:glyceraldehyde 3-phosphate dehydrogenase